MHSYCAFQEETNLSYLLTMCELKENVVEVLGQLWRCKVLEREKVVSLTVGVCEYLYNYLMFSTLLLSSPSFHPEFSEKNLSLCFHK